MPPPPNRRSKDVDLGIHRRYDELRFPAHAALRILRSEQRDGERGAHETELFLPVLGLPAAAAVPVAEPADVYLNCTVVGEAGGVLGKGVSRIGRKDRIIAGRTVLGGNEPMSCPAGTFREVRKYRTTVSDAQADSGEAADFTNGVRYRWLAKGSACSACGTSTPTASRGTRSSPR